MSTGRCSSDGQPFGWEAQALIRLVHLVPGLGIGGIEGLLLDLCRHHDRSRFDCSVASLDEDVSVIADEIRAGGTPVLTGLEASKQAVRTADLVNLHWCDYDAGLFQMAEGRPRVTTLHWLTLLPPLPAVTICPSSYLRELQPDPRRFVVIPNGIDVERFSGPPREPQGEVVITRVCRPPKCSVYFWDVVHELLRRHPKVRVQIVGNDRPAQHPSGRVTFLGVRRDIPEILRRTDIFLYTPYPEIGANDLVVMEASAAGVPCVLSDVNTVRESVEEGRNAFLVRYGDVEAAVERVSELVERPELRAATGRAAAQMAREQFDIRAVARKYEAVYSGVLAAQ